MVFKVQSGWVVVKEIETPGFTANARPRVSRRLSEKERRPEDSNEKNTTAIAFTEKKYIEGPPKAVVRFAGVLPQNRLAHPSTCAAKHCSQSKAHLETPSSIKHSNLEL